MYSIRNENLTSRKLREVMSIFEMKKTALIEVIPSRKAYLFFFEKRLELIQMLRKDHHLPGSPLLFPEIIDKIIDILKLQDR